MVKIMKWVRDHSLSLILFVIWSSLVAASWYVPPDWHWVAQRVGGAADGTFGVLVIVIFTKWFIERGSAESRE